MYKIGTCTLKNEFVKALDESKTVAASSCDLITDFECIQHVLLEKLI